MDIRPNVRELVYHIMKTILATLATLALATLISAKDYEDFGYTVALEESKAKNAEVDKTPASAQAYAKALTAIKDGDAADAAHWATAAQHLQQVETAKPLAAVVAEFTPLIATIPDLFRAELERKTSKGVTRYNNPYQDAMASAAIAGDKEGVKRNASLANAWDALTASQDAQVGDRIALKNWIDQGANGPLPSAFKVDDLDIGSIRKAIQVALTPSANTAAK